MPHGQSISTRSLPARLARFTAAETRASSDSTVSFGRHSTSPAENVRRPTFEKPVVAAHTGGKAGGGTKLTKFGEDLVRNYRAIAEKALRSSKANMDAINRSLRKG